MSVKGIFKVLIGTIVLMVVSSIVIEVFSISMASMQLNKITKMAANQSCAIFSQETYKEIEDDTGEIAGTVNMPPLNDSDGVEYISGKFYTDTDPESIYNTLYSSEEFKDWAQHSEAANKGDWRSLKLIDRAINSPETLDVPLPIYDPTVSEETYEAQMEKYSEAQMAKMYKDVMMTPLNMGVPYIDKDTINRIFRWNLGQLVSNVTPDKVMKDDSGNRYITFNGFRVYADSAEIHDLEYRTFDLTDAADRNHFHQLTNVDPDNLSFDFNSKYLGTATDERERVCVVGIKYKVPIAYEGVTPIRKVFNYIWETEVDGLNADARTETQTWQDVTADLESGGFEGTAGLSNVLPVPGKLIYYIIR